MTIRSASDPIKRLRCPYTSATAEVKSTKHIFAK
jgi:hypothetical protein